jgi:hypothetical protein
VSFSPTFPGHCYRTVSCFLQHHNPLTFECFGTALFDGDESEAPFNPYPITENHVISHKKRAAIGLGHHSPSQIKEMLDKNTVVIGSVCYLFCLIFFSFFVSFSLSLTPSSAPHSTH